MTENFKTALSDIQSSSNALSDAITDYRKDYENMLNIFLKEHNLTNLVQHEYTHCPGYLRIERNTYKDTAMFSPFIIKFYPLKKDGDVSKNPRFTLHTNLSDPETFETWVKAFSAVSKN